MQILEDKLLIINREIIILIKGDEYLVSLMLSFQSFVHTLNVYGLHI